MSDAVQATAQKQLTAVYAPFRSFITSLDYLKEGMPDQLDVSVWPTFSGGLRSQLLAGYRFLGLVDENGVVQPNLGRLVNESSRKQALAAVIKSAYPKLFQLDLSRTTPNQLADTLRQFYNVEGSTLEKAQTFFLHAARYVGERLSPSIARKTRTSAKRRRVNGQAQSTDSQPQEAQAASSTPSMHSRGSSKTIKLKGGGVATLTFDVDVFSMTEQDQDFVFDLIKRMREYEASGVSTKTETPDNAATLSGER